MKTLVFIKHALASGGIMLLMSSCVDVSNADIKLNTADDALTVPGNVNDELDDPSDSTSPDDAAKPEEDTDAENPESENPESENPESENPDTGNADIVAPEGFRFAAHQGDVVSITGTMNVAYGRSPTFFYLNQVSENLVCHGANFGLEVETMDVKFCFTQALPAVDPSPDNPEPTEPPVATIDQGLYYQTGEDAPWYEVLDSGQLNPLGSQSDAGVTGSKIDVKNNLVEVGPYARLGSPNAMQSINTLANQHVAWSDVNAWQRWYQVDGHTEIFRLFADEEITYGDESLKAVVESYRPTTHQLPQDGTWLEFTARYTIVDAAGCGLSPAHLCSILQTDGNEQDKWSVTLRLDANGDIWFRPRQGDAYRVATNMVGKGFDVRVRDNGNSAEVYIDDILRGTTTWPRTQEIGYRWGLFMGASKPDAPIMVFISGAQVYSNTPPQGYRLAANAQQQVPVHGNMDIAWGAQGEFHFLMNQSEDVLCANESFTLGDPVVGVVKQCYVRTSENNEAPEGFTFMAKGQQFFNIVGTMDIAWGANGQFNIHRNLKSEDGQPLTLKCDRATFGDPIPGVNKRCYYKAVPATDAPSGFVESTSEGGTVQINGTMNVAFGANGQFNFKNNQTSNLACNANSFGGDPVVGVVKHCYVQEVFPIGEAPEAEMPAQDTEVVTNGIKHPGMMTSLAQLKLIKQRYAANQSDTQTLVGDLFTLVNRNGRRIRNPDQENFAAGGAGLIYCGSYNKDKNLDKTVQACNWPTEDGIDAYTLALLGYITGDVAYSEEAIDYLESWSNEDNFQGFDPTGSNAALQYGWVLPWYANAAEVLRYTFDGWTNSHTQKMDAFIQRMLPLTIDDKEGAPNNWLHARIEAHMAAAIWLSDKNMFDTAVSRWKEHTPSYIYLAKDNQPIINTGSKIADKGLSVWDTPKYVAGMTMETCRDLNHQDLGVRAITNSMALARTQGVNIIAGNDNGERLRKYMEVQPVWWQSKQAHPDGICKNPVVIQGSDATGRKLADEKVHYSMPLAHAMLATDARPLTAAKQSIDASGRVTASRWIKKWEALYASTF